MRRSRSAKYEGATENILLDSLLQRLVAEASQAGALVIRSEENVPRMWTGVPVRQGEIPPQNLLQPRLCEPRPGRRKDDMWQMALYVLKYSCPFVFSPLHVLRLADLALF